MFTESQNLPPSGVTFPRSQGSREVGEVSGLKTMLRHLVIFTCVGLLCLSAACDDAALRSVDSGVDGDGFQGAEVLRDAGDIGDMAFGDDDNLPGDDHEIEPCGGQEPERSHRGWLGLGSSLMDQPLAPCREHSYSFASAAGSIIELKVESAGLSEGIEARVVWPDNATWNSPLADVRTYDDGDSARVSFVAPRSGDFFLLLRSVKTDDDGTYDVSLSCMMLCDRQTTRYPIVLVHGWTGWDEISSYTYFYQVADYLTQHGFAVYTASLDPYNSTEVRSVQLASQIDEFLSKARTSHVNIIAHSQGGLDSRRLISSLGYSDRVSALVTISTPHRGTPLMDVAMGVLPGFSVDALGWFLDFLGARLTGSESNAVASFECMTTSYVMDEFNPENPDSPDVAYISYAGKTCPFGFTCGDVCDVEIGWSYAILRVLSGDNDGIVPVSSAKWGDFRGTIPADHFDEVGQLAGVTGPNFDHKKFYLKLARDLAAEGH